MILWLKMLMGSSGVSNVNLDGLRTARYTLILLTITLQERRGIGGIIEANVNILLYIVPI